jgi:two-component sensor histidine kinase
MKSVPSTKIKQLEKKILLLKKENAKLKKSFNSHTDKYTVKVPPQIKPPFDKAEKLVGQYFKSLTFSPSKGNIEINNERYNLTVSDNGIGLSESVTIKTSATLGLQLINSLVEQLDGELTIKTGKGTSFVISFS